MRVHRNQLLLAVVVVVGSVSSHPNQAAPPDHPPTRHTRDGLPKQRPSWSPDGKRLAFARQEPDGTHQWVHVMEIHDPVRLVRLLPDHGAPHFAATFSPDGKEIALNSVKQTGFQGNLDILLVKADGTGRKVLLGDEQGAIIHQEWPAWSPNGKKIAFSSNQEGNQEIYTVSTNGTDVVRLTQHPGHDAHPCWSPDGNWIAFATDRWGRGLEIARVRPDGTGLTRLTDSPGLDDYPAFSPDGSRLAFVSNRDGQYEIYVMSTAAGSDPVNVSRHPLSDTFPTWTPDGRGITFVSERDGGSDIYTQSIEPSR